MFATKEGGFQQVNKMQDVYSTVSNKPYSPSVERELENTQQYLTSIEDAFESLLRKLEPVLPGLDEQETSDGKCSDSLKASELVEKVRRVNSRLYKIQYALEQLPNYIQL